MEFIHDELVAIHMPFDEPIDPRDHANIELLDSAVNRPFQTFDGGYLHPTLQEQAAALFHSLVCNHCFMNGNKRTAVMSLDLFMAANGYCLLMSNDDIYQMAKATAESNLNDEACEAALARISENVGSFSVPIDQLTPERFSSLGPEVINTIHDTYQDLSTALRSHPLINEATHN